MGKKLIALDMDGTMLRGRIIRRLAEMQNVEGQLTALQSDSSLLGYERTERITSLLKGMPESNLMHAVKSMSLTKNLEHAISQIKSAGHIVGIISDSYHHATDYVAEGLGLDFAIANKAEIEGGQMTGSVLMPLGWKKVGCYCRNSVCKRCHLEDVAETFGIHMDDTVAIGDTVSDSCMVERANVGIAFDPKDKEIEAKADALVKEPDFDKILSFI